MRWIFPCALLAGLVPAVAAPQAAHDSAHRAMQERGAHVMGVDQYTSVHHFLDYPDGGVIRLERMKDDSAGAQAIRTHLRMITRRFAEGDFRDPMAVHDEEVPGTAVMAARRRQISYAFRELPRGGEVRITTTDERALAAVHEFLAYQRREHHTE